MTKSNETHDDEARDGETFVSRLAATDHVLMEQAFAAATDESFSDESFATLRHALAFVSSLHFAQDERSAARTALAHFALAVEADAWHLYATRAQTALSSVEDNGKKSLTQVDSVLAFELLAASDGDKSVELDEATHGAVKGNGTTKSKSASKSNGATKATKTKLSQPTSAARAACEQAGATVTLQKNGAILAIALRHGERVVGVLEIRRKQSKTKPTGKPQTKKVSAVANFTRQEIELLTWLCQPLGAALANAARVADAERLSQIDDLTKLYNARFLRRYLTGEIKRAQRYKSSVAAFFFDIDDFKLINDVHGHLVGSHMLMEMAAVVLSGVRETDMVARYGGDEFVVVLPETNAELAAYVADRVRKRIQAHTFTGGRRLSLRVTASFGVAAYPQHAQSPQQLVHRADHAMYAAKANGKNCVLIDVATEQMTKRTNADALGRVAHSNKDSQNIAGNATVAVSSGRPRAGLKRQATKS